MPKIGQTISHYLIAEKPAPRDVIASLPTGFAPGLSETATRLHRR